MRKHTHINSDGKQVYTFNEEEIIKYENAIKKKAENDNFGAGFGCGSIMCVIAAAIIFALFHIHWSW